MTNITGATQTAIDGYAAAMAKGSDPSATIYDIASSMAKFCKNWIALTRWGSAGTSASTAHGLSHCLI